MSVVDALVLCVLAVGFILGLVRGFLSQVVGLVGVLGGVYLAWRYGDAVRSAALDPFMQSRQNGAIAFVAILLATVLFVGLIGWILRQIFTKLEIGAYDRLMGGVFGALKAGLLCGGVLLALVTFAADNGEIERAIGSSRVGPGLWQAMDRAVVVLPEPARREVQVFLENNRLPAPAPAPPPGPGPVPASFPAPPHASTPDGTE